MAGANLNCDFAAMIDEVLPQLADGQRATSTSLSFGEAVLEALLAKVNEQRTQFNMAELVVSTKTAPSLQHQTLELSTVPFSHVATGFVKYESVENDSDTESALGSVSGSGIHDTTAMVSGTGTAPAQLQSSVNLVSTALAHDADHLEDSSNSTHSMIAIRAPLSERFDLELTKECQRQFAEHLRIAEFPPNSSQAHSQATRFTEHEINKATNLIFDRVYSDKGIRCLTELVLQESKERTSDIDKSDFSENAQAMSEDASQPALARSFAAIISKIDFGHVQHMTSLGRLRRNYRQIKLSEHYHNLIAAAITPTHEQHELICQRLKSVGMGSGQSGKSTATYCKSFFSKQLNLNENVFKHLIQRGNWLSELCKYFTTGILVLCPASLEKMYSKYGLKKSRKIFEALTKVDCFSAMQEMCQQLEEFIVLPIMDDKPPRIILEDHHLSQDIPIYTKILMGFEEYRRQELRLEADQGQEHASDEDVSMSEWSGFEDDY